MFVKSKIEILAHGDLTTDTAFKANIGRIEALKANPTKVVRFRTARELGLGFLEDIKPHHIDSQMTVFTKELEVLSGQFGIDNPYITHKVESVLSERYDGYEYGLMTVVDRVHNLNINSEFVAAKEKQVALDRVMHYVQQRLGDNNPMVADLRPDNIGYGHTATDQNDRIILFDTDPFTSHSFDQKVHAARCLVAEWGIVAEHNDLDTSLLDQVTGIAHGAVEDVANARDESF